MKMLRITYLGLLLVSTVALAKSNPLPLINQPLIPASAAPGSQGFTLTVNGTGFVSGAVVYWNGHPRSTQFISDSSVQATITASDVSKAGTAWVKVVNPGKRKPSNVVYFTIRETYDTVAFAPHNNLNATGPLAVGDFNGDGKLDVAVGQANSGGTGTIQIFLGNGNGTFESPVTTNVNFVPLDLLAADFNNDGKIDLAVTYYDSESDVEETYIFLATSAGHLKWVGAIYSAIPQVAGDFNGDGKMDLIAVNIFNGSWDGYNAYLGQGNGQFTTSQKAFGYGVQGSNAAVGDFNGDGKLDFATSDAGVVSVFLGNGDGTFPTKPVSYNTRIYGSAVAVADVNGDGILDIVTDGVAVLLGNGDGTFTPDGGVGFGYGGYGADIGIGDFNGDGKVDIVAVSEDEFSYLQSVSVMLGNGDGTFQNPVTTFLGSYAGPPGFGTGDFNNDGLLDAVVTTYTGVENGAPPGNPVLILQTVAAVSPDNLYFGHQNLNTTTPAQAVTITNVSNRKLKVEKVTITGADAGDFADRDDCHQVLPPNGSCKIYSTFTPTQLGTRSATLAVNYKGSGGPQIVSLSGNGENLTTSLIPSHLRFPAQLIDTNSNTRIATLTNTGTYQITISKISNTQVFHQTNNCPSVLPVNQGCDLSVRFRPTKKGPAFRTVLVKMENGAPKQTLKLSGTGTVVQLSAESVNFGDQRVHTSSAPFPIKITNEGTTSLSISKIGITGRDASDFSESNTCGNGLPAKGSCTVKITFKPRAKGKRSAKLEISDDGGGSPQSVSLAGTGT